MGKLQPFIIVICSPFSFFNPPNLFWVLTCLYFETNRNRSGTLCICVYREVTWLSYQVEFQLLIACSSSRSVCRGWARDDFQSSSASFDAAERVTIYFLHARLLACLSFVCSMLGLCAFWFHLFLIISFEIGFMCWIRFVWQNCLYFLGP